MRRKNQKNQKKKRPRTLNRLTARTADPHILYERSVQCTESTIDLIDDVFKQAGKPPALRLREDFSGTSKLCADWVAGHPERTAVGVDIDAPTLAWAKAHNIAPLGEDEKRRVTLLESDVLDCRADGFDAILAFNFSYWVFHERAVLKRYFRNAFKSVKEGGVFLLDIYGGPDSQFVMEEETEYDDYTYVWDQTSFDPINNHIICQIHFRFPDGSRLEEAFTYDWRIWSMPELRDILEEVGFREVTAWWDCEDDITRPKDEVENLVSWVAYLAAWK